MNKVYCNCGYLGVILDTQLTLKEQTDKLYQLAYQEVRQISLI